MGLWLRRLVVLLTTIGFLAGGFGRLALAMAPHETCNGHQQVVEHSHHNWESSGSHQHEHEDRAGNENACLKCCGSCTTAPNIPTAVVPEDVRLIGYAVLYAVVGESRSSRALAIDPGIPKRIA